MASGTARSRSCAGLHGRAEPLLDVVAALGTDAQREPMRKAPSFVEGKRLIEQAADAARTPCWRLHDSEHPRQRGVPHVKFPAPREPLEPMDDAPGQHHGAEPAAIARGEGTSGPAANYAALHASTPRRTLGRR